jgi:hypothetical protein
MWHTGHIRTDGHMINPIGPSPRINGNFSSASSDNIIIGSENANVLPEPVNAMPIMSRPDNLHS